MGYYCTVPQCTSLAGKTKNVKFHRFPRDVTMADKWNIILKRGKPYTKYSKVCSLHFTQADYNVTTMGQWKTLSKDAVPSQNLPKLNPDGTVMVIRKSRTVKYREGKKEDSTCEKSEKMWQMPIAGHSAQLPLPSTPDAPSTSQDPLETSVLAYRLQNLTPAKPKKQDAFMQTDPVQNEDDDTQPNNSYSEVSEKSYNSEMDQYGYPKDSYQKKYQPKDYTKTSEDYIPQTNEEYNKEAEKYALERKAHNGYEMKELYKNQTLDNYHKIPDLYNYDKNYQRESFYQPTYPDSAELLRNQQHNLQILQEQHRVNENQNFFTENHIKQEIDINVDEETYNYDRSKESMDGSVYNERRMNRIDHIPLQVKQEPDTPNGCDPVMQPQSSPFYPTNAHNNMPGGFYDPLSRPGPELLIAKQNALAAHTQLWQNTMKRPFFYSDSPHYNGPQLLHRYEDISRILQ